MTAVAGGYYHVGTFAFGGGFNNPVGETNQYLNSSGTIYVAAGRNLNDRFGLQVEYTHNWLTISDEVIQKAQTDSTRIDDVDGSLWSMTLNGVFRLHPANDFVPWFTGGFGYYKRNLVFKQESLVYYPPVWDPWWGWIDGGWGPGQSVAGRRTESGIGFNVGGGVDMKVDSGISLFLEARYHHVAMEGVNMQLIPLMVGLRW